MAKRWMGFVGLVAVVMATAQAAAAQAWQATPVASVVIGGREVVLLGPAGGFTPEARAQALRVAIERRATPATVATFEPRDVAVAVIGGAPVVTWRGAHLITATAIDARLNGLEPRSLADAWSAQLRGAIATLRPTAAGGGGGGGSVLPHGFVGVVPGTALVPPATPYGW